MLKKEQCVALSFQPTEIINQRLKEGWLVKIIVPIKKSYAEEEALLIIFEREFFEQSDRESAIY